MTASNERTPRYDEGSLSLGGALAMGTGVMIGAGIFALTGQFTELAGKGFVFAFLAAAVVAGFSAYSIVMDIMIHWGVLRHLRREVGFCLSPGSARLSAIG